VDCFCWWCYLRCVSVCVLFYLFVYIYIFVCVLCFFVVCLKILASDGIRVQSKHMWTAFAGGATSGVFVCVCLFIFVCLFLYFLFFIYFFFFSLVLTAVTFPDSSSLVSGQGALYYTNGLTIDDSIIRDQVCLTIELGKLRQTQTKPKPKNRKNKHKSNTKK
jgi:hypothetical protein